jgi:GntR family transcriptional regulator
MSRTYEVGKSQRIAREIEASILAGHIAPGQRVTSVWELQEKYECTYSTAAKVLWMLARSGLVAASRGKETVVNMPDEILAFAEARIAELERIRNWAAQLKTADDPAHGSR